MQYLSVTAYTLTNACGAGNQKMLEALQTGKSALRKNDHFKVNCPDTWIGRVTELEHHPMPGSYQEFNCRNNRLALLALQQDGFEQIVRESIEKYGNHRVGLFLATSTSGVEETEIAFANKDEKDNKLPGDFHYFQQQNIFSVGLFLRNYLGLKGPGHVISTACSSSAKVFASASRHIEAGLCDAAIVGGIDTLCETTLHGFHSLQLLSSKPCRPMDKERDGISIGEAAGFMLLEKYRETPLSFLGYGESSDAYHISSPHPEGSGAVLSMRTAMKRAAINPAKVDYLNLHGTATRANDLAESAAAVSALGTETPCSSIKGWTGHTLGAAGITNAISCLLAIEHEFIPGTLNTQNIDSDIKIRCLLENLQQPVNIAMTNAFGFGGSNCSLIFGRLP